MSGGEARAVAEAFHQHRGVVWGSVGDTRLAESYGDPAGEIAAVSSACALWDGSSAGRLRLCGDDRYRFLNGLVTADAMSLEAGSSRYGLFTDIKGRILADATLIAHAEELWLRLPIGRADAVRRHMQQYVITDRVEITPLEDHIPLAVAGPGATALLADGWQVADLPESAGAHTATEMLGHPVRILREGRFGAPAFSLWVPASAAAGILEALLDGPRSPTLIGFTALEAARIAAGIPRFGADFDETFFPQEADLGTAVSYEKGCYLGQEVVARIHFRGGVHRILRGLVPIAGGALTAGEALVHEGAEVGRVTSAASHPGDGPGAIGVVRLSAAQPAARLETSSGVPVEVVELRPGPD